MKTYEFWTPTSIPTEAFSVIGLSAKPNSADPIGQFGTGLKLSIATVLRKGGNISLHVDGTEYIFYTKKRDFREIEYSQVMMRKRKGVLARFSYHELPFTLNYGRNLDAWQVYRELESNTRDENGKSQWVYSEGGIDPEGTTIRVSLAGLEEAITANDVFFDKRHEMQPLWKTSDFEVYDTPSKHLYFKGVRVFTLKNPSRFTYNFKDSCTLTEDRTPNNVWYMMHLIQHAWMVQNIQQQWIEKCLTFTEGDEPRLETHELTFDTTTSFVTDQFKATAEKLGRIKKSSPKLRSWSAGRASYIAVSRKKDVSLLPEQIKEITDTLIKAGRPDLADLFPSDARLKLEDDDVPF